MNAFNPAMHRFGDVTVRLSVELGRTDMPLKDVLSLAEGSVVPLDRLTDELLDVTANGRVVARGEVVAQDGRFALRIVSLVGDEDASPSRMHAQAGGPADAPARASSTESLDTPA
ncbi:MAG: flagellar motor switch protein FliN [Erythrobacter sp.]